jgi:hypothetical protein
VAGTGHRASAKDSGNQSELWVGATKMKERGHLGRFCKRNQPYWDEELCCSVGEDAKTV